jgi:hypothetical protein
MKRTGGPIMTIMIKDAVDATEPLTYEVLKVDCQMALGTREEYCVQANSLRRRDDIEDVHIFRNIAYVRFRDAALPVRYQLGAKARELARINDLNRTKAGLIRQLNRLGNTFELEPPRPAVSLSYLRSPSFKNLRKESATRQKNQTKRSYRKPEVIGLRHGGGKAHVWADAKG